MELKKKLVLAICSGNIVILAIFLWAWFNFFFSSKTDTTDTYHFATFLTFYYFLPCEKIMIIFTKLWDSWYVLESHLTEIPWVRFSLLRIVTHQSCFVFSLIHLEVYIFHQSSSQVRLWDIQKITDRFVGRIDESLVAKEKDLMEI